MYIKSITIDGFKSYGQRTIVEGFDPYFNAITGLNGSGKSNILDGICFLLGITNLSQVRAANLQELVYKNGQTGITKATVSITFDNSESTQSPIGYEHHREITVTRQIVIGGQNKYLINGTVATNSRVKDLFQSVQLNVNNPHFLIMQGRITKVLNMKPPEILSMIEEASGTKMYESKKLTAQKTIETKEAKIREIKTLLKEDITPTLTRLKEERAAFLEFQKVERELEHLTKLDVAYDYAYAEGASKKSEGELGAAAATLESLQINSGRLTTEIQEVYGNLQEQLAKREEKCAKMKRRMDRLGDKEKEEAKINSNLRNLEDCLNDEEKKLNLLQKNKTDEALSLSDKQNQLQQKNSELNDIKEINATDVQAVTAAENRLQAVIAGMSCDDDGQKETIVQQLMDAKKEIVRVETELKQSDMKMKKWKEDLKKKSQELKITEKSYKTSLESIKPLEKQIEKIKGQINNCGYTEGKTEQLESYSRNLQKEIFDMREKSDLFLSKFHQLDFKYDDPIPRFDRRKVKGFLCEGFTIKDNEMATALEVVAGGKLYNVIVDNEETGKLILEKGNLRKRQTIIPLNKIKGQSIPSDVLKRAQSLVGANNVWSALSLIDYDPAIRPAMEFAFGSCLVCRDMDAAKRVAFDPNIRKRTVTIDGEVFDPSGTLTGGSRKPGAPFLLMYAEMNQLKLDLSKKMVDLEKVNKDLTESKRFLKEYNELKRNLELKEQEAHFIRQTIEQTVHHKLLEEVESAKTSLDNELKQITECQRIKEVTTAKAEDLEMQMKNADKIREQQLKAAEDNLKSCTNQAKLSSNNVKAKSQEIHMLTLELEELQSGISNNDKQLQTLESNISEYKTQLEKMFTKVSETKAALEEERRKVEAKNNVLKDIDRAVRECQRRDSELRNAEEKNKLEIKSIQITINKVKVTTDEANKRLKHLAAKYEWIDEEKQYFGKTNTPYDFSSINVTEMRHQIDKLKERREELSRNVNMRAMSLLDQTEERYNELMKKKEIVKKDKETIAAVIKELDEKKKEALQTAWVKVNADFGSIFSTLLPGTKAKLVPLEGKSVLDGLEVKVAFGDTWKQSLNELSGGQRSLVALSLILSLLLFKPAPIYILDEVDAALDLSHTQNIGNMLKCHFKHSQFIIVSLKDGMFNNANVLYKTKFVDGMSTVTRHVQNVHAK